MPYAQPQAMPYAQPMPTVHPNAHPMAVPLVAGQCQPKLTRPSWGLRTARTGCAHQPPACCTVRTGGAGQLVPGPHVCRTRTSLGRAARTAYRVVHPRCHPTYTEPTYGGPTYAPSASHVVPMGVAVAGGSQEAPPHVVGAGAEKAKGSSNNFCRCLP